MFCEVPHTADISFVVISNNLNNLFRDATLALLSNIKFNIKENLLSSKKIIELSSIDLESLLVDWLNEVIFLLENGNLIINIEPKINNLSLKVKINYIQIDDITFEIKSCTYHNLKINKYHNLYLCQITFDM